MINAGHLMSLFAIIKRTDIHPPARDFYGLPRALNPTGAEPQRLEWPRVVLIYENADGVFLHGFMEDGSPVGDTLHESVADAKAQAVVEYDGALGEWNEIPGDLDEEASTTYALGRAGNT